VVPFPDAGGSGRRIVALVPGARTLLAAAALVVLGIGAYATARATSLFDVHAVEVRGASPATARDVSNALEHLVGRSLLGLDGSELLRRVEAIPEVAAARYDRAFPHTLVVTVLQERPAAVLRRGPQVWLVAESGRVLRRLPRGGSARFPRVWIPQQVAVAAGRPVPQAFAARAVAAVAQVGSGFPGRVRDVRIGRDELTFRLASGLELRLGDDRELALKLAIARRIIPQLASPSDGGAAYLDVSVVERPVAAGNSQVEGGA
jgi:cell division septal protein FtsQ